MFAANDIGPSLDRALKAFESPRLKATLQIASRKGGHKETASAAAQRNPDGSWTVRFQAPPTAATDRVDIVYKILPTRVDGWNRLWNETLTVAIPKGKQGGSPADRLALATPLPLEAELLISPRGQRGTFNAFRRIQGWTCVGDTWRARNGGTIAEVRFDRFGRWTAYDISSKNGEAHFRIGYPSTSLVFAPSSSARRVRAFAVAAALPKSYDEASLRAILAAHKHFRGQVTTETSSLTVGDKRLAERRADLSWKWSGGILTATANGRTKSAKAILRNIVATLGKMTGKGPDAYLHDLTLGRIPFANVLTPDAHVKRIGAATANGVACDVLEVQAENRRITLFVRQPDHLVASATVEALNQGQTMARVLRTYRYKKG